MSKSTRNSGTPWKPEDVRRLPELVRENTPTRVIGLKLARTPGVVYQRVSQEGISVRPTNLSPYIPKLR